MRQRIRFSIGAILAWVFVVMILGAGTSSAQLPWNPPCGATRVINYTTCTIVLQLRTLPAIGPITIPPCATVGWVPPAGLVIHGVISQAGNFRALMAPAVVAPGASPCGAVAPAYTTLPNAWIRGVTVSLGCCVDIYFYRNGDPNYPCTIAIFPSPGPCTP